MAVPLADAISFVTPRFQNKKIRDYAVSDFLGYREMIEPHISLEELQKTWALYLKWTELCAAQPSKYSSANGTEFSPHVKFAYKEGANKTTAPTLYATGTRGPGIKEALLKGVGQCEYFATMAYADLAKPKVGSKVAPTVKKISTPNHNWVIVNHEEGGEKAVWVNADYWLFALGIPAAKCICASTKASIKFHDMTITLVKTYDPNTETETVAAAPRRR